MQKNINEVKSMKKLTAILLTLALAASFLVGCGGSTEPEATTAGGGEATVQTVEAGKLIMATNAAFPPYEFIADDGETITGVDAEIAKLIADELGLELQIEDMEFGSILTAIQQGKVDIGLAGMTVTEERLQNVNFTTSYAKGIQSIIVPEGSEIKSVDDLAGKMIGVQESTTGHIYCEDEFGAENVTAYSIGANAVEALLSGKVDCVVIDNNPAKEFVKANEGLVILDTAYAEEDYAAAVAKENQGLLDAMNAVLDAKIADGTIQGILDKYISAN